VRRRVAPRSAGETRDHCHPERGASRRLG
jgi:hypothetical protein